MRLILTLLLLSSLLIQGCDTATTGCSDDYDCEADRVCRLADGQCEQKICKQDDECAGDGIVCRDNRCLTVCVSDTDCGANFSCIDGVCTQ